MKDKMVSSQAILKFIQGCLDREDKITDTEKATLIAVKSFIERLPSCAIIYGEWKRTPLTNSLYCTACDQFNKANIESAFCPNCGAKMGEIKNE